MNAFSRLETICFSCSLSPDWSIGLFTTLFILFHFQAQAEERAAMLRAQLEQRKKVILERINKEGKDKLEKVCKSCKMFFFQERIG